MGFGKWNVLIGSALVALAGVATVYQSSILRPVGRPLALVDLVASRGGNQAGNLQPRFCDTLTGLAPCTTNGAACFTCSTANYNVLGGVNRGNYTPDAGLPQTCGNKMTGQCNPVGAGLQCQQVPGFPAGPPCAAPPLPPGQQPINP